jgi:hypothetical protein
MLIPATTSQRKTGRPNSIREAFVRRAVRAVERLAANADEAALVEALASPTDFGTLVRVLVDIGAIGMAIAELDPEAVDRARELGILEAIAERAGGMLSAVEAGRLLGISRQAVEKRRRKGGLLAIRQGGDWLYPRVQFHDQDHGTIPGLASVIEGFGPSSPWLVLEFLVTPDSVLGGRTPSACLVEGGEMRDMVATLIRGHSLGDGFA